jgi:hypothetical protein
MLTAQIREAARRSNRVVRVQDKDKFKVKVRDRVRASLRLKAHH